MSILVTLSLATICFSYQGAEECYPVIVGRNNSTPVGEYVLQRKRTKAPGYGGDVLQFKETETIVYAIHRVWLMKPEQQRMQRLRSEVITDRFVSEGCINVEPEVYTKLLNCCSREKLTVKQ